eukprot:CAMPEP_0118995060 /NCGR_PEP_ID=MMETSP1173-20130426/57845_1 /TAXON_ID=1034831 /ORGANISM="Rhizochromulina marina cf, Strain CCMP1243" /LENGTH=51 /DNA_ID=CAMNT_0006946381 /DNA_START=1 /DNA_END=156 /DNA_ORIENTATION=+
MPPGEDASPAACRLEEEAALDNRTSSSTACRLVKALMLAPLLPVETDHGSF